MESEVIPVRQLFGGAIDMCIPARLVDVSDFRPVPDNQEVLADGATDQSVIVEILEHCKDAAKEQFAAEYYYNDLVETMGAEAVKRDLAQPLTHNSMPELPETATMSLAIGKEAVSKGQQGKDAANILLIALVAIQLPSVQSDILITLYTPQYINPKSAAAEHTGSSFMGQEAALQLLDTMLQSFSIRDWSLFNTT